MTTEPVPDVLLTLWILTLVVTLAVLVPVVVYSLYRLVRAANSIRTYAREAVAPTQAIAASTAALPALDTTIGVATDILAAAETVAVKLATIATVLEARSSRLG